MERHVAGASHRRKKNGRAEAKCKENHPEAHHIFVHKQIESPRMGGINSVVKSE